MSNSLRESRINAVKIIYSCHMTNSSPLETAESVLDEEDEKAVSYAVNTINSINEIDDVITKSLYNYTLSRLNLVDRAIIELATYEMINGVAPSIAIDEALEITKQYTDTGDKKAVSFNNKLLDNIKKNLGK